jgi:tRNA (cmo5U34)-methyltransferase
MTGKKAVHKSATDDRASDFEFNEDVANIFDDMLLRSVPAYLEQQNLIEIIAKRFWQSGTSIVDLGSSLGTTLINVGKSIDQVNQLIGYDNSRAMIARAVDRSAASNMGHRIDFRFADLNGDLQDLQLENSSVVTLCWTLQFIRPLQRDFLIRRIYESLVDGGVLVVAEKVLINDSEMNRFFIDFYYDFKRANGYSDKEILKKREALENVLIPYRFEENLELFRRNGFETVETFFQWFNFAGFLCVKTADS